MSNCDDPVKLYETPWLQLFRKNRWDYVRRPHADHAVGVLAITPEREVILVEQCRIPIGRACIELPAGIVGDEAEHVGESLAETARRELLEETGYDASKMTLLYESPTSPGMTSEYFHVFLAEGLGRVHDGGGLPGEGITVHLVPLDGLREWLVAREGEGKAVFSQIYSALWMAALT